MTDNFDVVVIGSGPGGYIAAIRAAQLGMSVACIEKYPRLGGTCLNVGCIPSKALLQSSERWSDARFTAPVHGIKYTGLALDLSAMLARKDKVVDEITKGVAYLFRKYKVTRIAGTGTIAAPGEIDVALTDGGTQTIRTESIIVATGSEVASLPSVDIDGRRIISSTGAIAIPEVPKHLVVIGGGYIGLELGSVWRRLGAAVTVVEFLDRIVPGLDSEVGTALHRALEKQGIDFRMSTKVIEAKASPHDVTLTLEPAEGGVAEEMMADVVLVAVGRRPYTRDLGLEAVGVELDEKGRIKVDGRYQTSVPGIYAIGDVIAGPMLAHKAEEEGVACAEILDGQRTEVNYKAIPSVVYTWPEVASVGRTEEEIKAEGLGYKVGKFPFLANGRARANGDREGFVKFIADAQTNAILGCHIIGPDAGALIAEVVLGLEFDASAEDIGRTCHAHPTLNEAVKEAALSVYSSPLNY